MDRPLVSVIMSAYNEPIEWIEEAIQSVLNQTYKNIEFIIILDNPENKKLDKVIKDYKDKDKRIKYFTNEKNIGLTRTLNIGLEKATGDYIARMDADDICMVNRIEEQINYLTENNSVDFVSCNCIIIDEQNREKYKTKNYGKTNDMTKRNLMYRSIFLHPTWIFRKSILEKLHNYNEIERAEDYDFLCRLISNGYSAVSLDSYLVKYRIRDEGGISSSNLLRQKRIEEIIKNEYKLDLKKIKKYSSLDVNESIKNIMVTEKQRKNYNKSNMYYLDAISYFKQRKIIRFTGMMTKSLYYYPNRYKDLISVISMNVIKKGK